MRPAPRCGRPTRLRDWAELLRAPALFTVPGDALAGDALAGAAPAGLRPNRGTAYAACASLRLYHAAGLLTAAGLTSAARAGRPALGLASVLSATVWAYDLRPKRTPAAPAAPATLAAPAAPAAMAAARALDLPLGATATLSVPGAPRSRRRAADTASPVPARRPLLPRGEARAPSGPVPDAPAVGGALSGPDARPPRGGGHAAAPVTARRTATSALALAAPTYAVTAVSRHEAHGGSALTPLAALGATTALGVSLARTGASRGIVPVWAAAAYVPTAAVPCLHAALDPSPPLTRRAVSGGIRAMIPLQAALAARSGANATALAVLGLAPMARTLARKVSPI
ncbi:SCO3242 family prenyltransferase [Streptomyces griseoruber]